MRGDLQNKQIIPLLDRKTLVLMFIVGASFAHIVCAQAPRFVPPEITITPEPVGSGARALGQSAFIAVADDATAASWNPAGLTNLQQPETSFVGAWRTFTNDYSPAEVGASDYQEDWSQSQINFMSYAQPIEIWDKDMVISVNYHQVYDFGIKYDRVIEEGSRLTTLDGKSEGSICAYSLAGGWLISSYPEIAFGASFNWYTQSLFNDYIRQTKSSATIDLGFRTYELNGIETLDDFRGHNFTFGLLWDVYERHGNLLTLGLVYHTPFTAKMDWESVDHLTITQFFLPPFPLITSSTSLLKDDMEMDLPASIGAGVNYRISDELSVAFDVEWKEWSKFKQKFGDGTSTSPFDSDTVTYRLGFEHLTKKSIELKRALRCGLFYEERPVANYTDTLPVYGLSAGFGWTEVDRYSLDFAYQYRWGNQDLGEIDLDYQEHFLIASLIFYF